VIVAAFSTFTELKSSSDANKAVSHDAGVRIGVVQQDGNPGGVEVNRRKALDYASQALALRADVILFHEELLVGYVEDPRDLAEPASGVTTQSFQKLLRGNSSIIVYGLTERDRDKYYISAIAVSKRGIVARYRKTHLFPDAGRPMRDEPAVYTPGNKLVAFRIKGYLAGLMICFDGDFPEMARSYAKMGCTMLFWMNNRPSRGHHEVRPLASSNSMIIATSCCTGQDESGMFCPGGSNITGANGELVAEIWNREGLVVANVHPSEVEALRGANVFFTQRRPDLYRNR
jgi:predicted amidohydrolase